MNIGIHVKKENYKSLSIAIKKQIELVNTYGLNLNAVQIFVEGPKNFKSIPEIEQKKLKEIAQNTNIYVHSAYLTPLCPKDTPKKPKIEKELINQINICDNIDAKGFIIHIPNKEANIISERVNELNFAQYKTPIFLENEVTKLHNYNTPTQLAELINSCNSVNVCVDTCHLFATGVELASEDNMKYFIETLLSNLDDSKKLLIHLNDSTDKLGSFKDSHNKSYFGMTIWKDDLSGLKWLIDFCNSNSIDMIMEVNPDFGKKNYEILSNKLL